MAREKQQQMALYQGLQVLCSPLSVSRIYLTEISATLKFFFSPLFWIEIAKTRLSNIHRAIHLPADIVTDEAEPGGF